VIGAPTDSAPSIDGSIDAQQLGQCDPSIESIVPRPELQVCVVVIGKPLDVGYLGFRSASEAEDRLSLRLADSLGGRFVPPAASVDWHACK
jgi:hypothetical protein